MYTSVELVLFRAADPGAASLASIRSTEIRCRLIVESVYSPGPFFYVPSENEVVVNKMARAERLQFWQRDRHDRGEQCHD